MSNNSEVNIYGKIELQLKQRMKFELTEAMAEKENHGETAMWHAHAHAASVLKGTLDNIRSLQATNSLDLYQNEAHKTAVYPEDRSLEYTALGMCGEAGEVANKVKKVIRDDEGVLNDKKRADIIDELSDVMWYLAECCTSLRVRLSDVARHNIMKLRSRAERGKIQGDGDSR